MRSPIPIQALFAFGVVLLLPLALLVFTGLHDVNITCSLYHNATLDEWWPQNSWKFPGITLEEFREFPFPDGLTQLDGRFIEAGPEDIQVGDIMVFRTLSDPQIIGHRVIRKWSENLTIVERDYSDGFPLFIDRNETRYYFSTVGDNSLQQPFEREIDGRQVFGKVTHAPVGTREGFGRFMCKTAI